MMIFLNNSLFHRSYVHVFRYQGKLLVAFGTFPIMFMYDLVRRPDFCTLIQYVATNLTNDTLRHCDTSLALKNNARDLFIDY
jgi:hypothetical protein